MNDFFDIVITACALLLLFFLLTWWLRMSHLSKSATGVLDEISRDTYDIREHPPEDGVEKTELFNDDTRIFYLRRTFEEEVIAKRFFVGKETSGANVLHLVRSTAGGANERNIRFWQHHHLWGRMFYNVRGTVSSKNFHALMDELVSRVHAHMALRANAETKTPS